MSRLSRRRSGLSERGGDCRRKRWGREFYFGSCMAWLALRCVALYYDFLPFEAVLA
jgi:hypothetical protein